MIPAEHIGFATCVLQTEGARFYRRFGKRVVDVALALAVAPIVLPVLALLWLLVRTDGGTGLYGHLRVGRDGRTFRCWKLRTMRPDADRLLAETLARDPAAAAEWAAQVKLSRDPRVTPIGRILRLTALDEVPQLWNVLRGDMSIVGPRPVTVEELARYGDLRSGYLSVRPGLTGPWQVLGRGGVHDSYAARVQFDRGYVARMSFGTDLRLMYGTARLLLRVTATTVRRRLVAFLPSLRGSPAGAQRSAPR